jgi:cellulose synthase/poly-beta-1,6-N-acetylglucosamine synthase-like glycosyltransferase
MNPNELPPVSVIIPARNAAATLADTLESVLAQDYAGGIEVIVADGSETVATGDLVRRRFPGVRVVPNPGHTTPCGLNCALRVARYPVVARCDAHAMLPAGYLTRAVGTLLRTGAANVGGRQNPVGDTIFERAVALGTTTPLGAGDARYRIGGGEGPVDTVYLGVFRRDALDAVGGFDETIPRNEDYDLNWRLHERGETVWFDPGLAVDYRPRGSLRALARQYFDYGRWKRVMLKRHPRSWRLRHVAAPLLLAALAASAWLGVAGVLVSAVTPETGVMLIYAAAAGPLAYVLLLLAASAALGLRRRRPEAVLLPVVAATIHLAWAAGFFAGALADAGERWR